MNPHRCAVVLGLSRPVVRTILHRGHGRHRPPSHPMSVRGWRSCVRRRTRPAAPGGPDAL